MIQVIDGDAKITAAGGAYAGLDRYERRTRSRFKAAIRAFDEASSFWRNKANLA